MPGVICCLEMNCQIQFFFVVMELLYGDELRTWDDWFDEVKRLSSLQMSDLIEVGLPPSACFTESDLPESSAE